MKRRKDQPPIILRLKRPRDNHGTETTSESPIRLRLKRVKNDKSIPATSRLLSLPPELRNTIWELLMNEATKAPIDLRHFKKPPITQVCRQTREETSGMIVPALQDKKWRVPLLICLHCGRRLRGSDTVEMEHTTFCENLGEDLVDWSVAPWLRDLAVRSRSSLATTKRVQFYREVQGDGEYGYAEDGGFDFSRRRETEDDRLELLNEYGAETNGRLALDLAKILSLAERFHAPHFLQFYATQRYIGQPERYKLHREVGGLPLWARENLRELRRQRNP